MKITIKPCHYLMMALKFNHLQHVRCSFVDWKPKEPSLPSRPVLASSKCCVLCIQHLLLRIGNIFVIASTSITRLILNEKFFSSRGFAFNLKSDVDFNAVHFAHESLFCGIFCRFPFASFKKKNVCLSACV